MKSRYAAAIIAIFLGGLGIHKFYLNRPIQGIFYLLFCWTYIPAIFGLFEGLVYIGTSDKEFNLRYNNGN